MSSDPHDYTLPEEQYDEDKDDESYTGNLLQYHEGSETQLRGNRKRSNRPWPMFLHITAIVLYGLIALLITYHVNKTHKTVQSLIYSPANDILEYSTKLYDLDLLGDSDYFGTPSPQIDKNWHELMARMY
ncbi:MAG: hypothetical protein M1822_006951 [Bathelium mastoideum]|nr:MAG: hypothetical protein M1822_006951 [Bathelium mastoideum]